MRVGLGAVFLTFGLWKISSPVDWIIFTPGWLAGALEGVDSIDPYGFLRLLGFVEAVLGAQVLLGLFTKAAAALSALGLIGILAHVGFDQIGVRDLGLLGLAISLSLAGGGQWSLDRWLESEPASEEPGESEA